MKTRLLFIALLLCGLSAARAATITVNSTADPAGANHTITIAQLGATVTLRNAINAARNTGGTHTITFAPSLAGQTIYVANWDPTISWTGFRIDGQSFSGAPHTPFNLTIQGLTGNSGVTIARDTVNYTMGFFYVGDSDTVATFNDLTFTDANLAGIGSNGGAFNIFGATVNMNRCTLTNNRAASGGAIAINGGTLNATNCTLTGNYAQYGGGAIYKSSGVVSLTHTTITNNATSTIGAGLYNPNGSDLLVNTIIAGNVHGQDIGGGTVSSSSHHNLIGDAGNAGGLVNGVNGNIVGANPLLNGLANNGGPTQTAALSGNSPALNAAANGFASTDQRGISRPQDSTADIGAYELIPTAPTAFSSSGFTTFAVNNSNSFNVTANGAPPPRYSVSGTLPAGVTLTAAGFLSGNPPAGSEGTYPLTITASNGAGSIMQSFTLTVISALFVTTTVDEDNGSANPALGTGTSLREAINFANTQSNPATITFAPSLAGQTINLTINGGSSNDPTALPIDYNKNITIQGLTGNNGITIRCGPGFQAHLFYVHTGATLTVNDVTLANGFAYFGGGAVVSNGVVQMNRCTLRDNSGGNTGGAIWSGGVGGSQQISLTNCTLANNQAGDGGGIWAASSTSITLANVTVSGNSGGGLSTSGNVTVINTIIAGNTKGGNPSDVNGNLNSSSHHNLIGTGGSGGLANGVNGNIVGVADAKLVALASNGGPTQTMALLTGSPAIDAGAAVNGVTSDQRGLARPQGGAPDIGAFETVVAPVVTLNPQDQTVPLGGTATFIALANYIYSGNAPSTLATGASLLPGQYLLSPKRAYQLIYQNDGNLVLYRGDGIATWSSGTGGQTPDHVIMQADGNMVIYGPGGVPQYGTGTSGNPNAVLKLQDDGNLVIYTTGGVPVFGTNTAQYALFNPVPTVQWQVSTDHGGTFTDIGGATDIALSFNPSLADNGNLYRAVFSNAAGSLATATAKLTVIGPPVVTVNPQNQVVSIGQTAIFNALANYLYGGTAPSTLSAGGVLSPGQYLLSPGHGYQLLYQTDGNLVLYRGDGVALWGSGTAGQTADHVTMQADGNLVIYGPGVAQWASNTAGNLNAVLKLQDDGNLVIYTSAPAAIFATNTAQVASLNPVPTVQWQVSTDHGATFTNIAGATGVTLSVTPSLADNDNRYRAMFSNASGSVATAPATLTILTALQVWRALQSLAPDGSQDLAKPAGDGVANLLKYAFNMAPNAGDLTKPNVGILPENGTAGLPYIWVDAQRRINIEFVRRKTSNNPGIDYIVETGGDLNNLIPLSLAGASVVSIDSTWERVTITDPTVATKRFGHVRIQAL
jgi:CSLREA domain-containing protein